MHFLFARCISFQSLYKVAEMNKPTLPALTHSVSACNVQFLSSYIELESPVEKYSIQCPPRINAFAQFSNIKRALLPLKQQ